MLGFCQNIAGAMRSLVKHTPTLLPSRGEKYRLKVPFGDTSQHKYRSVFVIY